MDNWIPVAMWVMYGIMALFMVAVMLPVVIVLGYIVYAVAVCF